MLEGQLTGAGRLFRRDVARHMSCVGELKGPALTLYAEISIAQNRGMHFDEIDAGIGERANGSRGLARIIHRNLKFIEGFAIQYGTAR